jgi:TRAP-type C4-dicarboxylate transport system permease small subunit
VLRLARSVERIVSRIVKAFGMASIVLLGVMMMLTVADVTLRYLFNSPIMGSMELTEYIMVCVGTLGLAWCALQGAHIKVDLIVSKLPMKSQNAIDTINYLLVIGISLLITSQTFVRAGIVRRLGMASAMLDIPQYPFLLVVSFSYLLLLATAVILLIQAISSLRAKEKK